MFEKQIKDFLTLLPKTWFFKHWAGPYSKSGIPDIIACVNGRFVGIEVKASDGHASELQTRNIRLIEASGGIGYMLYPKDFEAFKREMRRLLE